MTPDTTGTRQFRSGQSHLVDRRTIGQPVGRICGCHNHADPIARRQTRGDRGQVDHDLGGVRVRSGPAAPAQPAPAAVVSVPAPLTTRMLANSATSVTGVWLATCTPHPRRSRDRRVGIDRRTHEGRGLTRGSHADLAGQGAQSRERRDRRGCATCGGAHGLRVPGQGDGSGLRPAEARELGRGQHRRLAPRVGPQRPVGKGDLEVGVHRWSTGQVRRHPVGGQAVKPLGLIDAAVMSRRRATRVLTGFGGIDRRDLVVVGGRLREREQRVGLTRTDECRAR